MNLHCGNRIVLTYSLEQNRFFEVSTDEQEWQDPDLPRKIGVVLGEGGGAERQSGLEPVGSAAAHSERLAIFSRMRRSLLRFVFREPFEKYWRLSSK